MLLIGTKLWLVNCDNNDNSLLYNIDLVGLCERDMALGEEYVKNVFVTNLLSVSSFIILLV